MSGASTPISIVPTLDVISVLTDPRDILAYVLRWYTTVPKSISDSTPAQIISMTDAISRYQDNPRRLTDAIMSDLRNVYSNYFGPNSTTVDVSTSDNGNGTYNVTIQLATTSNGSTYALGSSVTVDGTGALQLKFHPTLT